MLGGGIREISCGFVGDILSVKLPHAVRTVEPPMQSAKILEYNIFEYIILAYVGVLWYNSSNTISYTITNNLRVEITLTIYMAYMCEIVSDYFYSRDY